MSYAIGLSRRSFLARTFVAAAALYTVGSLALRDAVSAFVSYGNCNKKHVGSYTSALQTRKCTGPNKCIYKPGSWVTTGCSLTPTASKDGAQAQHETCVGKGVRSVMSEACACTGPKAGCASHIYN